MNQPDPIPKPPSHREDALAVLKRLRDAGHTAYFAGGCVRDLLLGVTPKDYDVATDAPPSRVREVFPNTQAVGAAFGVILVRQRKSQIEVATFRTDGDYSDGRRPDSVRFTTAEEDAQRRDFTINGLFLDPTDGETPGRIIDYVGGQADLTAKVIRAIGDPAARFGEDHLRMLRAVRFAARLGFTIDPQTAGAIRRHTAALKTISPERIADELRRMLVPPTRKSAWQTLWQLGLAGEVFRHLPPPSPAAIPPEKDLVSALSEEGPQSFGVVLTAAAIAWRWATIGPAAYPFELLEQAFIGAAGKAMRVGLKISNEELDEMAGLLKNLRELFIGGGETTLAMKKRIIASPTGPATIDLLSALLRLNPWDWRRLIPLRDELQSLSMTDCAPTPLISGDDLIAAGIQPGRVFKRALDLVYDAQLESRVIDRDAALKMALELAAAQR